ncbi:unnamed protein product [Oncorhynchus mykiss]|uniref:Uncharacterized protein n=1 Tax=Oncorhynchus mykiss TaxID=8022 RepID=A0A060YKL5_ONCMY|nr:unnamed protein product [Oncorhynchus mykiss]
MEDPEEEISPYCETVFQTRRPLQHSEAERTRCEGKTGMTRAVEEKHGEDHGTPKLSWAKRLSHALHSESQGYSTVGEAAPPPLCLSLPPNLYPSEPDEDQTISPYASYTSLSEQTEPIICGWLDKLSPQGYAWSWSSLPSSVFSSLLRNCLCLVPVLSNRCVSHFFFPTVFLQSSCVSC